MVYFLFKQWGLFVYMCCFSRVHIFECLRIDWHASLHIYTYFCSLFLGRGETKKESMRSEVWVRCGKWIFTIRRIFSFDFMIAKGLFNVNMKYLFCGEFCWVRIMIKIEILITLYICVCVCVCCQRLCGISFMGK